MPEVREGSKAPEVTFVNWDREPVRLSDLFGKTLVLAFFPGAFTSVCTREMSTFSDMLKRFEELDARVVGISVDSPFAQKAFAEKLNLKFPLLSDYNRQAVKAFGVEDPSFVKGLLPGVAKRAVFVLDPSGTVTYRWVSDNPSNEPDYEQVREAVRQTTQGVRA